ncbi:MAG: hypothetical protein ABI835_17225 [Chloroflexota bacterium]
MARLGSALATAMVIGFGLLTVWGLIAGSGIVFNITSVLLQLTVITIAVTILIGILNLFGVHLRKIGQRSGGWFYSLVVIVSAAVVLVLWIIGRRDANQALLETVGVSVESALAGLIVFALVYGAYRMMRRRVTWSAVLFTLALLIILVGALPLPQVGALTQVRAWLLAVPVSAGARGILLGIALATVVTGVRVLIGQDRSYRE